MPSLKRAFLGVRPPGDVLDAVERLFERSADRRFRWTTRPHWHVTLQFYGRVAAADALVDALGTGLATVPAGEIRLCGGGAFPDARKAQVFWLGVEDPAPLARAHEAVVRETSLWIAPRDRVPYVAHLTLARLRRATDLRDDVAALEGVAVGPPWTVTEVVLFESETNAEGPSYQEVARLRLGG